jgi:hypothetical protein
MIFMKRSLPSSSCSPLLAVGILLGACASLAAAADPEPATPIATDDTGYSEIATFAKAVE